MAEPVRACTTDRPLARHTRYEREDGPMQMVPHLRLLSGATPLPAVPLPAFGSPADLADTLCRQVDELAAIVEHCASIAAGTSVVLRRSLGEAHVLLDELSALLGGA